VKSSRKDPAKTGAMVVEQNNATGRVSYWQARDNHSEADGNGVSLAEYIHAMYGLLRQAKSRDILMIGCGGGTLATMLHRVGVNVVIVDIDPASFQIAHDYFHLPHAIECHVADGKKFLRKETRRFDAVVLDAYSAEEIPKHLVTTAFFDLAKSRMHSRKGTLLSNVILADDDDPKAERLMRTMRKTWSQVRLLDSIGYVNRNAVIAAGSVRDLKKPRLLMPPAIGARKLAADLKVLDFHAPKSK
jgi:spermidine synthase